METLARFFEDLVEQAKAAANRVPQSRRQYVWRANPGACKACMALNGRKVKYNHERPHPNCRCELVEQ